MVPLARPPKFFESSRPWPSGKASGFQPDQVGSTPTGRSMPPSPNWIGQGCSRLYGAGSNPAGGAVFAIPLTVAAGAAASGSQSC